MNGDRHQPGGSKPVVLTVTGHYLPGWKAGGQIATISAAVDRLRMDFDFRIICVNGDLGDKTPYAGVESGVWRRVETAEVCYLPAGQLASWWKHAPAHARPHDLIWLHGMFNIASVATLAKRWTGGLPPAPVIMAPQGELSAGALGIKARKKQAFLLLAKRAGLYGGLWWEVTSPHEELEVTRVFPHLPADRIRVVRNPASVKKTPARIAAIPPKQPGTLRLVFLSRISRKKNLDMALQLLSQVAGDIAFDVFGPMEDAAYWAECQAIIRRLSAETRVTYRGPLEPAAVIPTLATYHAFLFPTRGENFGYVILEALQAGCLPLISDATPWRGLERAGAGWDIPLSEPARFAAALRRLLAMDADEFATWSTAAASLGRAAAGDPEPANRLRALFTDALRAGPA